MGAYILNRYIRKRRTPLKLRILAVGRIRRTIHVCSSHFSDISRFILSIRGISCQRKVSVANVCTECTVKAGLS